MTDEGRPTDPTTATPVTGPRDDVLPEDAPPDEVLADVEPTGVRRRRRRKRSAARNVAEWLAVLAGALVVALLVQAFLFKAFYIPSESMEPTLHVGDRVLVNRFSYDLDDVDRGDIVVFERPESWGSADVDDLIKRVIGLPGEEITFEDNQVHVDGEAIEEPWLPDGTRQDRPWEACDPSCELGPDEIFVLGDNRDNSEASNRHGPLDFDRVIGHAIIRVWPLGDFGGI